MKLVAADGFCVFSDTTFIYYIKQDSRNHRDKFYKTDLISTSEITLEEYASVKFGKVWESLDSPYTDCIFLQNGEYLSCVFHSSTIFHHNVHGRKIYQYKIASFQTGFDTIYSITLDRDGKIWIAQPSEHSVSQYSLETEELLFKIGGDFEYPHPLNYPEQVAYYDGHIYISDMGNNRICKLHIDSKKLIEYLKFDENAWEYIRYKGEEIVRLESGIYIV